MQGKLPTSVLLNLPSLHPTPPPPTHQILGPSVSPLSYHDMEQKLLMIFQDTFVE